MQLTIIYQDKSTRVINLHSSFFSNNTHDASWEERAMQLSYDTGKPTHVQIIRDGDAILTKRVWNNITFSDPISAKVDERQAKKQLRRQFKNIPFTSCNKYQL